MNELIQVVQVLTPDEVLLVNEELDKKEFIVSSIGFVDGETGEPRVDSDIRSSSGCYLLDHEEAAKVKYKTDRTTNGSTVYASFGDQLDMLYADMLAGKLDTTGSWATHIKAVKDANPKPS